MKKAQVKSAVVKMHVRKYMNRNPQATYKECSEYFADKAIGPQITMALFDEMKGKPVREGFEKKGAYTKRKAPVMYVTICEISPELDRKMVIKQLVESINEAHRSHLSVVEFANGTIEVRESNR